MNARRTSARHRGLLPALLTVAVAAPFLAAGDGPATWIGQAVQDDATGGRANERDRRGTNGNGAPSRRQLPSGLVKLAFDDVGVKETIPFLAEATGKVVIPVNLIALQNKKITLINDEAIERAEALDLLFRAFRLNGVGVVEQADVLVIGLIDEIMAHRILPVLTADDDVIHRQDKGSLVVKIYQLTDARAEDVGDKIGENIPSHASLIIDPNSNQIIVAGDIALCQHFQKLITELDNTYVEAKTETFRLAHADATEISENILDLFENTGTGSSQRQTGRTATRTPQRGGRTPQAVRPGGSMVGPEIELRVTVNVQQNSVTVSAEPDIVDEIARLIEVEWDLARSPGTSKIYTLQYTDPLKVAEKLNSLLGQGGGGGRGGGRRPGGGAAGADVSQILSGIYRIEAFPDTNQLLVFSKTEQAVDFLDTFITELDQRSDIGLPFVMELKHASAIELAEELNALLSEPGTGMTIGRPDEGLFGRPDEEGGAIAPGGGAAGTINFPWQRGGRQTDEQSPESALIGKVRIVPIVRQNALAVLCPAPQRTAVEEIIAFFDRPGRQVMISAIIAEVELTDELALGWRISNSDDILSGGNPDFRLGGQVGITGTDDDPFDFFDMSTLDASMNVNIVVQALAQKTNVRILQEPIIFTADNQEAIFFDGQDIPFITNTTINTQGNPTDSFEYREVGVVLNVRPRITVERDVDLELNLTLSSVVPGVTLFGGAIIDRRETRTHVIVENGQTIVISGILREEESKVTRGIPLLSDIPLLGELFKSRENSTKTTELIAFVTPYVVDNPSENDSNFQEMMRERLDELNRPVDIQAQELKDDPERIRKRVRSQLDYGEQQGMNPDLYEPEPILYEPGDDE